VYIEVDWLVLVIVAVIEREGYSVLVRKLWLFLR
jgi:hypothetical protein